MLPVATDAPEDDATGAMSERHTTTGSGAHGLQGKVGGRQADDRRIERSQAWASAAARTSAVEAPERRHESERSRAWVGDARTSAVKAPESRHELERSGAHGLQGEIGEGQAYERRIERSQAWARDAARASTSEGSRSTRQLGPSSERGDRNGEASITPNHDGAGGGPGRGLASLARVGDLLRHEPRARVLLAAHAQSSLGNGAAYVGLLVIAYERFPSPWAVTLVLLADLVPAMLLGPLFGAAADRWSRRRCAVIADLVRAVAFVGIALVGNFEAMVAFAVLAGVGTGLYGPAVLAGLPSLVSERRLPAATSLYGALDELGWTLGPLLAGAALLVAGPESLMVANGLTFAVSALLLARLPFGARRDNPTSGREESPSLVREAGDGLRALSKMPAIRTVMLASSGLLLFAGGLNVGELFLATDELGAGHSGYAVLLAVFGLGVGAGSLAGSQGGDPGDLKARYLWGMLLAGTSFVACGLAPTYSLAVAAFALGGFGNGLVIVHERLLVQAAVPDEMLGRMFGVRDTLQSWGFAPGFVGAGALAVLLGPRALFLIAGAGALLIWAVAAIALRNAWRPEMPAAPTARVRPALAES